MKLSEVKQLSLDLHGDDMDPNALSPGERALKGEKIVKRGDKYLLKFRGMSNAVGIGDIVSLRDGRMLEITQISKGQVRLENGKLYGPKQLFWAID